MFGSKKTVQGLGLTRQRCSVSRCASTKVCLSEDSCTGLVPYGKQVVRANPKE